MTRKEKSVIWIQVECDDSLAVLKYLGHGNVERVPSQWICSPGAWGNPSFTVVSPSQKVIGLAPREVKSREIHKSQCEKLSLHFIVHPLDLAQHSEIIRHLVYFMNDAGFEVMESCDQIPFLLHNTLSTFTLTLLSLIFPVCRMRTAIHILQDGWPVAMIFVM